MKRTLRTSVLLVIAAGWAVSAAAGGPACHCFQQRDFDPDNPQAVEPYLLATTGNSLMAVAFGVPKRTIVKDKMGGVGDADLWLALGLSEAYRIEASTLLAKKRQIGSWSRLVGSTPPDPERLEPALMGALVAGRSDEQLADEVLVLTLRRFGLAEKALRIELDRGVNRKELALAALIAQVLQQPLEEITRKGRRETGGWARLTQTTGLLPDQMEAAWLMVMEQQKAAD